VKKKKKKKKKGRGCSCGVVAPSQPLRLPDIPLQSPTLTHPQRTRRAPAATYGDWFDGDDAGT